MSHAWVDRPSSAVTLGSTDTTVAQVIVPAGTYIIFGKAAVNNGDTSNPASVNCDLSTGDTMQITLDSYYGGTSISRNADFSPGLVNILGNYRDNDELQNRE